MACNRYKRFFLFTFIPIIIISCWYLSEKLWRPPLKTPRPLTHYHPENQKAHTFNLSESCQRLLNLINPPVLALLIDSEILLQVTDGACDNFEKLVKIGVDEKYLSKSFKIHGQFEVSYYKNDTDKDYLDFLDQPRSIIPKNFPSITIGNLMIPTSISQFLDIQKRSKFIDCRNITMSRDPPRYRFLPFLNSPLFKKDTVKESIDKLARLRDELLYFGMIPFLNGGTLLGWYRECSVIPHTRDMDIGVFGETWNHEFYEYLWTFNSSFTLERQIGLVNNSYELTVIPKTGYSRPIDLFLMYKDDENERGDRWVGGLTTRGDKIKYLYPDYDPFCAADLMGHIFWVTCTPDRKITEEYGPTWYLDQNSSKYVWYGAKNAVKNGKFTRKQMRTETYNEYKSIIEKIDNDNLKEGLE